MKKLLILILCMSWFHTMAQGKLMLVGGGSENRGDWSDSPYRWAVEQSANRRVAIIGVSEADRWLADYFVSLGARQARNFRIDSKDIADKQETYDSLMSYDMFFFRGGDQYEYYVNYKNTKTQQAIKDKFNAGGVIGGTSAGMAILSGVMYTAQYNSIYPDEALQNPLDPNITLADDFLPFLPGYVADTHFIQRGRFPRLVAFMSNWYLTRNGQQLTGIGVDDLTAFCIDASQKATVYGLGAVNIYRSKAGKTFKSTSPLQSDSIRVSQLLHGSTMDLASGKVILSAVRSIAPSYLQSAGLPVLLLSGSSDVAKNEDFLKQFVQKEGHTGDAIAVVSSGQSGRITALIEKCKALGANSVTFISTSSSTPDDAAAILKASKIILTGNTFESLQSYLKMNENGKLLMQQLTRRQNIVALMGKEAMYVGAYFVENHEQKDASYRGEMIIKNGFGWLASAAIMTETYLQNTSDFYENTASAIPYMMADKHLATGIWLNEGGFARYSEENSGGYLTAYGKYSAMVLQNPGTTGGLASQVSLKNTKPRQVAGFESMYLSVLAPQQKLLITRLTPLGLEDELVADFEVFPNPVSSEKIHIRVPSYLQTDYVQLADMMGKIVLHQHKAQLDAAGTLDISSVKSGSYLLVIDSGKGVLRKRIVIVR